MTAAQQAAEQQRRRDAALAAGGALAIGGEATKPYVDVAAAPARTAMAAAIVTALIGFLAALRKRHERWLTDKLGKLGKPDDVALTIAEEMRREDEFARASADRVAADIPAALVIPDPEQRAAAVRGILAREQRYAQQHSEAMAARAIAAVSRLSLRRDSPMGAFWKLDPTVKEHTAGCLVMGGRFWPWAVLDRVHPPRHAGCPCRLLSYGEAIADGHMGPGDVPNVTDALRRASGIVMEAEEVEALIAELELRDRLIESGVASAEALAGIPLTGIETEG